MLCKTRIKRGWNQLTKMYIFNVIHNQDKKKKSKKKDWDEDELMDDIAALADEGGETKATEEQEDQAPTSKKASSLANVVYTIFYPTLRGYCTMINFVIVSAFFSKITTHW